MGDETLTSVSLFAGGGGDSLGAEWTGFKGLACIEIWEPAVMTHRINFPGVPNISRDVRNVTDATWRKSSADVVFGGFPCQGFSMQGGRDVFDPRNMLYKELLRCSAAIRPDFVVAENVEGLLSMDFPDGSSAADGICADFGKIGYNMKWKVLCAADYGAPTSRRRIVFIGSGKFIGCAPSPEPMFFDVGREQKTLFGTGCDRWLSVRDILAEAPKIGEIPVIPAGVMDYVEKIPQGGKLADIKADFHFSSMWNRVEAGRPFPTIIKSDRHFIHPWENRRFSSEELQIFQSFPRTFRFYGSYSQRVGQIGNSVSPLMAAAIYGRISESLCGVNPYERFLGGLNG